MNHKTWWVAGGVAAGLGLSILGGLSYYMERSVDIPGILAKQSLARFGRELSVSKAEWSAFPTPSVTLLGATLRNPERQGNPSDSLMASMESAQVWVGLWPLIHGDVKVVGVKVVGLSARWMRDPKGKGDWDFKKALPPNVGEEQSKPAGGSGNPWSDFKRLDVERISVEVVDPRGKEPKHIELESMGVKRSGGKVKVQALARVSGQLINVAGELGPEGDNYDAELSVSGKDWSADLKGRGSGMEDVALEVDAKAAEVSRLLDLWAPGSPIVGAGRLKASLARKGKGIEVSSLDGQWGQWSVSGSGKADLSGAKPRMDVAIRAAKAGVGAGIGGERERPVAAEDAAIPWSMLNWMNAKGTIEVDGLSAGPMPLGHAKGTLDLREGVLSLAPFRASVAGGQLNGQLSADAKSRSAELAATLSGTSAEAIERAMGSGAVLSGGPLSARMNLRMSGSTKTALMSSVGGSVSVDMGASRWASSSALSLAAVMGGLLPAIGAKSGYLDLQCLGARMNIERGVATGSPIVGVEGPALSALASGSVNIGAKTLDMSFELKPKGGLDIASISTLASAVRISGPWASPKVGVDASKAGASLATIGSAISTGGTSLLAQALARRAVGTGPNACLVALGKVAAGQSEPKSKVTPAGSLGGAMDKLRKLFGG